MVDLHTNISGDRQRNPILLFLHAFSPKSTCVRGGLAPLPMGNPGSAPDQDILMDHWCALFRIWNDSAHGIKTIVEFCIACALFVACM